MRADNSFSKKQFHLAATVSILALGVTCVSPAYAQEAAPENGSPVVTEALEDAKGTVTKNAQGEMVEPTAVDKLYRRTTDLIQGTTGYFDSFFFADTEDAFTSNETRVRLRLNTDYIDGHGWDFSPNIRLNLALPFLNDKVRLVMNEDTDEDQGSNASDSAEGSDLALRWVELDGDRLGLSFDLGLRLSGVGYPDSQTEAAGFARINTSLRFELGKNWSSRSNNRLYYYSNTKVRNDFRQYFDRPFNDNVMFRSRTRVQYFEENGYNPQWEQKLTIFHKLNEKSAIAYEAVVEKMALEDSIFDPEDIIVGLQDSYYSGLIRLRYRRNIWRPWFFVEVWPTLAWPEERDYETTPAVRIRFEINFGPESGSESQMDE
jgi:hypothetical protein